HLGEADVVALVVEQRGDDDVGPEARAVFAIAPALLFVAALGLGATQLLLGMLALAVFVRIEDREVLADDLVAAIALQALGADVPAGDVAVDVEHEDGVVAHRFDHDAEALLALAKRFGRVAQIGDVACDLDVAGQSILGVAQRSDGDVRPEAPAVLAQPPILVDVTALAGGDVELA